MYSEKSSGSSNLNIGCGDRSTKGWVNMDGSPSAQLAKCGYFPKLLFALKIIIPRQYDYILFVRTNAILYADATRRIPVNEASFD